MLHIIERFQRLQRVRASVFALVLGLLVFPPMPGAAQGSEAPRQADAFVESMGVAVHFGYDDTKYYQEFETIKEKLDALGIRYIRDGIQTTGRKREKHLALYRDTGIQMLAGFSPRLPGSWPQPLDLRPETTIERLEILKEDYGDMVVAIEGPNEYGISHGPRERDWVTALRTYQEMLYGLVNADPDLEHLPVVGPSMGRRGHYGELGNAVDIVDRGNMHPYPGGRPPTNGFRENVAAQSDAYGDLPVWATETGYHNALVEFGPGAYVSQPGVSEEAEARYLPRLYAYYFDRSIEKTFSYEFMDLFPNPRNNHQERNFGMIRNDLSEKPVYEAVQRTIALLEDPGPSFKPRELDFSLSGDRRNIESLLLQKRDGRFYLLIWQEVSSFDLTTKQLTNPEPREMTLHLRTPTERVRLFHPLESEEALETISMPEEVVLQVPDHLLIVEIVPATDASGDAFPRASIEAAHPNPFSQSTTITYNLLHAGSVRLSVYDVLGRQVALLVDGEREAGDHEAVFDGSPLPSGVYVYRLEADDRVITRRMVLQR